LVPLKKNVGASFLSTKAADEAELNFSRSSLRSPPKRNSAHLPLSGNLRKSVGAPPATTAWMRVSTLPFFLLGDSPVVPSSETRWPPAEYPIAPSFFESTLYFFSFLRIHLTAVRQSSI